MQGRTVKYQARGFEVRTELARSVRENDCLVFHVTAGANRLINSLLYVEWSKIISPRFSVDFQIFRKMSKNPPRIFPQNNRSQVLSEAITRIL